MCKILCSRTKLLDLRDASLPNFDNIDGSNANITVVANPGQHDGEGVSAQIDYLAGLGPRHRNNALLLSFFRGHKDCAVQSGVQYIFPANMYGLFT